MPNGLRALRIARTVRHRQKVGPRVTYAVNADGSGEERGIPEQVVLVRWRRRVLDGYVFRGGRLPPSTWRALPLVLGADVSSWSNLSVDAIRECLDAGRDALKRAGSDDKPLRAPSADVMHALIAVLGVRRLQALVTRHADVSRHEHPGVPDLFLYALNEQGRVQSPRFVEVKRPREPVHSSQTGEIAFLLGLGLNARVFRLVERGPAITSPNARDAERGAAEQVAS